jgi:glutamine synthetase
MQIFDYLWLGGNNEFRTKTRILDLNNTNEIPDWNYDGSSTNQASGFDSEIILKPCIVFKSPLTREIPRFIVLCETFDKDGKPLTNNHRRWAKEIFDKYLDEKPWYGLEQEYFLFDPITNKPIGFKEDMKQGQFYCSVGTLNTFGREVAERHMMYCLKAGINLSGINAEVAPGQWEFQVGPCEGINAGDQLLVARFLLELVAEEYGLVVVWHPKPLEGDWNGSGCHTNFSTLKMREENGLYFIEKALDKLALKHQEHLEVYGNDNHLRLTGEHETSNMEKFSVGRANRGASVRIGNETILNKRGYFEDRRPASNCDPYLVTAKILETICQD